MTAWFHDNEIYRNDVNAMPRRFIYGDGEPPALRVCVIESGDKFVLHRDKQVVMIVPTQGS